MKFLFLVFCTFSPLSNHVNIFVPVFVSLSVYIEPVCSGAQATSFDHLRYAEALVKVLMAMHVVLFLASQSDKYIALLISNGSMFLIRFSTVI